MSRSKTVSQKATQVKVEVVFSSFEEEDRLEDVREQNHRITQLVNLGNGGYVTRARAMSDDC